MNTFLEFPWEAHGYTKYPISICGKSSPFGFQKTVKNEEHTKKLYFINFEYWDLSLEFPTYRPSPAPSVVLNVQLFTDEIQGSDSFSLRISFQNPDTFQIASVESFVSKVFLENSCIPDIHNNGNS